MRINMIKQAGGALVPASDIEADRMKRFKNFEHYEINIKLSRTPGFLRKMFVFFNFCFAHWCADRTHWQFMDEKAQFETFRKDLTIQAGFYVQTWDIGGNLKIEAESLAFENMEPERFSQCYNALINCAMAKIFRGTDREIYDKLHSFF